MAVKRVVANIASEDVPAVARFYREMFGLDIAMDHGWIVTLASTASAPAQISVASEGGSGTPIPDVSIEVDDVDATYAIARRMDAKIVYELTDEPWGVRRFYVLDPAGKTLNVLGHIG